MDEVLQVLLHVLHIVRRLAANHAAHLLLHFNFISHGFANPRA